MPEKNAFVSLLEGGRAILSDGAMGTVLHQRGVAFEECFDVLNLNNPALVAEVHRSYIEAGSQIIQTNTFGANRFKLARHGLENEVERINAAGVELARRVVWASYKPVLVAGDIGPLGIRMAPFGRVKPEQARAAFSEQVAALAKAGVDLLVIETISDLKEILEAIAAVKETAPDLPLIASMTFTRDDRTLLGENPIKVARSLSQAGATVIGVNCSGGPNQILRILKQMRAAAPESYFSAMPNAGWPEQVGGRIMYPAAPDYFSEYALAFCEAGTNIIGGCCGTTPQHIAAMSTALLSHTPGCDPNHFSITINEREDTLPGEQPTQLAEKLAAGEFVVSVEMDPPRGLSTHKLLAGASLLAESGADVINVADSPMASMRMSPWAVCSLLQQTLGIETVLHFPTRGRNLLRVQGDLLAAHALDVRNVFVVMGDPTAIGDYPNAMDNYDVVPSGLIKLIKQGFNAGMDHAGSDIGQPTSFFVGTALNLTPTQPEQEIKNLRRKLKAGADFILTQPIYDPEAAVCFIQQAEQALGHPIGIPILIGILPLVNSRHAAFLHNEVPGISIPEPIRARMEGTKENTSLEGIKIAIELIEQMRPYIQGVYLMPPFNRFDTAAEIIDAVKNA